MVIGASDVQIVVKGDIGDKDKRHAREQLAHVTHYIDDRMLFARVKLTLNGDPANERPAIAQAMLDVNGHAVRAVGNASGMHEAIDVMCERLRRQLEHLTDRRLARRNRGAQPRDPHEWRKGDLPTARPPFFPRPPEDRKVVRCKTYALEPLTAAEAADQMTLLDYDFHLFHDVDTDRDAIVERVSGAGLRVRRVPEGSEPSDEVPPVSTSTVEEAIDALDLTGEQWIFFRDSGTMHGAIAYRRYDGHYGVVTAV